MPLPALDAVDREFRRPLHSFFARRVGGGNADDAVQDTLLQLHRIADRYDPAVPLSKWVFGVAKNIAKRVNRSRGRHYMASINGNGNPNSDRTGVIDPVDEKVRSPHDNTIAEELKAKIRAVIHQLPDDMQNVVNLHLLQGFSQKETAKRLKWGDTKVYNTMKKARPLLAERFQVELPETWQARVRAGAKARRGRAAATPPPRSHKKGGRVAALLASVPPPPLPAAGPLPVPTMVSTLKEIAHHAAALARLLE